MATTRVFVDGQEGTTGLRILEYLAQRSDIEVLRIAPDRRKDADERARLLNAAASGRQRKVTSEALISSRRAATSLRSAGSIFSTDTSFRRARYSLILRPVVPSCPSTKTLNVMKLLLECLGNSLDARQAGAADPPPRPDYPRCSCRGGDQPARGNQQKARGELQLRVQVQLQPGEDGLVAGQVAGGISTPQAESSLRVLRALGIVRLVQIDGALRYRLSQETDSLVSA